MALLVKHCIAKVGDHVNAHGGTNSMGDRLRPLAGAIGAAMREFEPDWCPSASHPR